MHESIRASSSCMLWNNSVERSQKGLFRREWWVFGQGSSQMGFRRDLFFISVCLVGFSDSVSPGSTHLWHFVLVSVWGRREEKRRMSGQRGRAMFLKWELMAGSGVWWAGCTSGTGGDFHDWWTFRWCPETSNHSEKHLFFGQFPASASNLWKIYWWFLFLLFAYN